MWLLPLTGDRKPRAFLQTLFDKIQSRISPDGVEPNWRHDGKELYYLALDGKLMSVPVKADRTFVAGRPVPLFQTVLTVNRTRPDRDRRFDVTHDGQRFLIVTLGNRSGAVPVTVVVNWPSAFRK